MCSRCHSTVESMNILNVIDYAKQRTTFYYILELHGSQFLSRHDDDIAHNRLTRRCEAATTASFIGCRFK